MKNRLTIYFTSDTHGYLFPTTFADDTPRAMGLIPLVEHFRAQKDGNTLVIDGGDTIQGSPLTYYYAQRQAESPVADVINYAPYDYVTLGNHDFNQGQDVLARYLNRISARCLCANVTDESGRMPIFPATVHTLENGTRVALIGIVTDFVKRWEKPENLAGLTICDPLAAAREAMHALDADLYVGIYHGGIERDLATGRLLSDSGENIACRLAEELPFDILLTGHQHAAFANQRWHGTHIVQTPDKATAYARVCVDEAGTITSAILPTAVHPGPFLASFDDVFRQLNVWLDTPIGHLNIPLKPGDHIEMAMHGSPIANFINQVQADVSGADISVTSLANDVRGFDESVTVRDVVSTYIYANTLSVLRITGAQLKTAIERTAEYFDFSDGHVSVSEGFLKPKAAHYNYDYYRGIEYTLDLHQPCGARVVRLTRDGHNIAPDDTFTICMNSYRATGVSGYDVYLACPRVREIMTEVSEIILTYFTDHNYVTVSAQNNFAVIA